MDLLGYVTVVNNNDRMPEYVGMYNVPCTWRAKQEVFGSSLRYAGRANKFPGLG